MARQHNRRNLHALALFLAPLILPLTQAVAQSPTFSWVEKAGGAANDYGYGIAVDGAGNSYIAGSFNGSATFAETAVTGQGGNDIFVAKYDNAGNLLWARSAGGATNDAASAVAVDGSGNCYVTGFFQGTAAFGTTTLTSAGGPDIFVAKYDSAGNLLWVRQAGGPRDDRGYAVAVDGSANVYVAGTFNSTAVFDTTNLVSAGVFDIFVAKYDGNGHLLWVRQAGGSADDYGTGVAVDNSGNCYLAGHFGSPVATFDTVTLTNRGGRDVFVAKYGSAGNLVWVRQAGGAQDDVATAIAADGAGNSFVTGYFYGTAAFGSTMLNSTGLSDIFVAKYDGNGNLVWAANAGGPGDDYAYGVALNSAGACFLTGGFSGTVTFGSSTYTGGGIFVLDYDSPNHLAWSKQAARDAGEDYGFAIASDSTGNCYLTGFLDGNPCNFDNIAMSSTSGADIYVARLDMASVAIGSSQLAIRLSGNQIVVSWPTNMTGFTLQYAATPNTPGSWQPYPTGPSMSGNQYIVTEPLGAGPRFYRLKK
jgi:hypothetical protein